MCEFIRFANGVLPVCDDVRMGESSGHRMVPRLTFPCFPAVEEK